MSYSIDVDVDEYDVLDSMTRQEILDYLKLEREADLPVYLQRLAKLDLTLSDLIELERWMAGKPIRGKEKPWAKSFIAPPTSAEASGQAQLSPGQ